MSKRAKELKNDEVQEGSNHKEKGYLHILKKHGLRDEEIAYVGDDVFDIPILKRVGLAVCVASGADDAKRVSHYITHRKGGDGAVREVVELPVGDFPQAIAFDGANIWVANSGSDNVTKLRASDGANLGTFPVGDEPRGIAFDGANIWVANLNSDNVTKLRASDGANLGTFTVGDAPVGTAFDGANIWVANQNSDNVTKL